MTTRINLEVGERAFHTTKATLTDGSRYFRALFSGAWKGNAANEPCYLDSDGDAFAHILRYLRLRVFPLPHDESKGHDYAMYGTILEQAKMLGVDALIAWLEERKYLKAMKMDYIRPGNDKAAAIELEEDAEIYKKADCVMTKKRVVSVCPVGDQKYFDDWTECYESGHMDSLTDTHEDDDICISEDSDGEIRGKCWPTITNTPLYAKTRYDHHACIDRTSDDNNAENGKDTGLANDKDTETSKIDGANKPGKKRKRTSPSPGTSTEAEA